MQHVLQTFPVSQEVKLKYNCVFIYKDKNTNFSCNWQNAVELLINFMLTFNTGNEYSTKTSFKPIHISVLAVDLYNMYFSWSLILQGWKDTDWENTRSSYLDVAAVVKATYHLKLQTESSISIWWAVVNSNNMYSYLKRSFRKQHYRVAGFTFWLEISPILYWGPSTLPPTSKV